MIEFESLEGALLIKNDMTSFACHKSRDDFIREWCARPDGDPQPIYEVIVDRPARLHFDVEGVYPGPVPSPAELRTWLDLVIGVVKEALEEIGVDKKDRDSFAVASDCRASSDGYKRSFHLVWSNVFFANNHTEMKAFIDEHVTPKIKSHHSLQWIAQ
jgi:hypothetical protein